jgi:hypothetical protein
MQFFLCSFEFAYFFADSLIHIFLFSHGYSALFVGFGGLFSLLVGSPTADPSSRRKEKASRTEKSMLACW